MANVIIKTDEQKDFEKQILRDFGHDPKSANKATMEYAEATARITAEAIKKMEREQK
jgi:hypothetical protein